ncbi:GspH/FimT family pseudopilin [Undibacterium sp. RuRC25W]|uniref:GspH/FimT family pseudopilin n=1 Tax=Undibacterium sp. RuRC25W TaxID=3413047 RepID=UPI003BF39881
MNKHLIYRWTNIGFTLVEILVCLSIVVILMSMALPSFYRLIEKQRLKITVAEFYAAINLTRAEAIKRSAQVSLIPNDRKNWQSGWKIVVEADGRDDVDVILFSHEALAEGFLITHNFTDASQTYISYAGQGQSRTYLSSQQPLAGTVSMTLGENTKRIKVNFLGRARICEPTYDLTCSDS